MEDCYFQREMLVKLRLDKNLKQSELAFILNMEQYTISRLETGLTKEPSTYTLWKISKFFQVPMESFLGKLKIKKN